MNITYSAAHIGLVNLPVSETFKTVPWFGVESFGNIVSIVMIPVLVFLTTKQNLTSQRLSTMRGSMFVLIFSSAVAVILNGSWSVVNIIIGWVVFVLGVAYLRLVSVHTILSLTYIIILTPWNMWWVSIVPILAVGVVSFLQVSKTAGIGYAYFLFKGTLFSIFSGGLPFFSGKAAFSSLPLPQTSSPVTQESKSENSENGESGEKGEDVGGEVGGGEEGEDSDEEIRRRRLRGVKVDIGKIMILSYLFISVPAAVFTILF